MCSVNLNLASNHIIIRVSLSGTYGKGRCSEIDKGPVHYLEEFQGSFYGPRLLLVLEGAIHRIGNEPLDLTNLAMFASKPIGMFLYKNK